MQGRSGLWGSGMRSQLPLPSPAAGTSGRVDDPETRRRYAGFPIDRWHCAANTLRGSPGTVGDRSTNSVHEATQGAKRSFPVGSKRLIGNRVEGALQQTPRLLAERRVNGRDQGSHAGRVPVRAWSRGGGERKDDGTDAQRTRQEQQAEESARCDHRHPNFHPTEQSNGLQFGGEALRRAAFLPRLRGRLAGVGDDPNFPAETVALPVSSL